MLIKDDKMGGTTSSSKEVNMVVIKESKGKSLQELSEKTNLFYTAKKFSFLGKFYLEVYSSSKVFLALIRKELMDNDDKELFDNL